MLFIVMLGGKHQAAKIEVHDVVFASGDSLEACYPQLRQQWFGLAKGLHIDSWWQLHGVDGWQINFSNEAPAAGEPRLFFINLGGYLAGQFGEDHHYLLVVAKDAAEAKQKGKQQLPARWLQPHTDNVVDVDDCIPLDWVAGRYVRLTRGPYADSQGGHDYILL